MAKQNTNNILKTTTTLILILIIIVSLSAAEAFPGGGGFMECKDADVAAAARAQRGAKFQALRHCGGGGWLLAKLPKRGVVPPSGPSRRTNGHHY